MSQACIALFAGSDDVVPAVAILRYRANTAAAPAVQPSAFHVRPTAARAAVGAARRRARGAGDRSLACISTLNFSVAAAAGPRWYLAHWRSGIYPAWHDARQAI